MNSTADNVYIIELPGQAPREITNINYDVLRIKVESLGGKLYLKPRPVTEIKPSSESLISYHIQKESANRYPVDVNFVVNEIKQKHFANCPAVMNIPVRINSRLRRTLGYARYKRDCNGKRVGRIVELNPELTYPMNKNYKYLRQVIYHEFLHIKYPMQGHFGLNFRYEERNNPYRINHSNRLTCVS